MPALAGSWRCILMSQIDFPHVRSSIDIRMDKEGNVHFVRYAYSDHVIFSVDEAGLSALRLMDGRTPSETIAQQIHTKYPSFDLLQFNQMLATLADENLIFDARETPSPRFDRLAHFWNEIANPWESPYDLQQRLANSRVGLIGIGGIGTWVLMNLAQCGVRHYEIIDPDVVELTNLPYQALFSMSDVGTPKVIAAQNWLERFDPAMEAIGHNVAVTPETNWNQMLGGCDVVISCADSPSVDEVGLWVDAECLMRDIPHLVGGGYQGHRAAVGTTIVPGKSACWQCVLEYKQRWRGDAESLALIQRFPTRSAFAPLASFVGGIHAWEAVRILLDRPPLLTNKTGDFDLNSLTLEWNHLPQDTICSHHER